MCCEHDAFVFNMFNERRIDQSELYSLDIDRLWRYFSIKNKRWIIFLKETQINDAMKEDTASLVTRSFVCVWEYIVNERMHMLGVTDIFALSI